MSTFGWLDTDPAQRRRMLEGVDLFKDAGSEDELGIGAIRDALSDAQRRHHPRRMETQLISR